MDWVSNKLYWIDALWARVEVMDTLSMRRAELIRTSNHSIPRSLAVDPMQRLVDEYRYENYSTPSVMNIVFKL